MTYLAGPSQAWSITQNFEAQPTKIDLTRSGPSKKTSKRVVQDEQEERNKTVITICSFLFQTNNTKIKFLSQNYQQTNGFDQGTSLFLI